MEEKLNTIFEHIEKKQDHYIARLSEAVAIKSVSGWPHVRDECFKMVKWIQDHLERLGAKTELKLIDGKEDLPDGTQIDFPPILFGSLGSDKNKKTICIYGHLDVQPAIKADGWETEPFTLAEIDGKLFGRGASDDKGPVIDWINCIEAYRETGNELPVNIKFVFECMEETGSQGLDDCIEVNRSFFDDVSFVCISDNYWLTTSRPCLTYGLRGSTYYNLTVECAHRDLHSGIYGGAVHEAMWDLIALMNSLVASDGRILVPGVYDHVVEMTPEEEKLYKDIEFDMDAFRTNEVGTSRLLHEDKAKVLQYRWRYPSLSIHGIEGDFSDPGAKTVIPRKVVGKFSLRLVPNMKPEEVGNLVKRHIEAEFAKRNSPNKMTISVVIGVPPWLSDIKHINYEAGRRAIRRVWGIEPDMTREGCTIPVTLTFQDFTGKNVLLLPVGQSDDGAHSNNEKISRKNYINGVKLLAAYFEEAAAL